MDINNQTDLSSHTIATNAAIADCGIHSDLTKAQEPTVEIGRFSKQEAFTFSGEHCDLATIIEKVQGNGRYAEEHHYIVTSHIQKHVKDAIQPVRYHQAQSSRGLNRIFSQKQARLDGFTTPWFESLIPLTEAAVGKWITMASNRLTEQYEFSIPRTIKPLPDDWPDFGQQLQEAFEGRIINSLDHPVLKRLGLVSDSAEDDWGEIDAL